MCSNQGYIIAQIDPHNTVGEANENNNAAALPVTVTHCPGTFEWPSKNFLTEMISARFEALGKSHKIHSQKD